MQIIEQDGGLWQVWNKAGRSLGFVFDSGWKASGQKRPKHEPYAAMLLWTGYPDMTMNLPIGKHPNFMRAVRMLFDYWKK